MSCHVSLQTRTRAGNCSRSKSQTTFPSYLCFFLAFRRLSPMRPLDTSHSPVSPLFPLDTRKQGGTPSQSSRRTDLSLFCPRSISLISIHFPTCTVSRTGPSSLYPLSPLSLSAPYQKNRGRGEGTIALPCSITYPVILLTLIGAPTFRAHRHSFAVRVRPGRRGTSRKLWRSISQATSEWLDRGRGAD
jgi:hypothetical protein